MPARRDSLLEQRLQYHVENSPLAVIEWDQDWRVNYWSKQAERMFGYRAEEIVGRSTGELGFVHPEDAAAVGEVVEALRSGREVRNMSLNRNVRKDGSVAYCEWYNSGLRDARGNVVSILSLVLDVTERHRYEEERLRNELQANVLAEAGKMLAASLDFATTIQTVVRLGLPAFASWSQIDLLDDEGLIRTEGIAGRTAAGPRTRLGVAAAIESGEPIVIPSEIVVPLRARGRLLGTLTFGRDGAGTPFGQNDLPLAQELALRSALSLDNARLYEREHRVADTLQRAMLPTSLPQVEGFTFNSAYSPAAAEAEVGGDWYDAFVLSDGRVAVSIGDVTGHGLRAAALMGEVRQSIRASAFADESPVSVLDRANRLLTLHDDATIVTAVFGVIDPRTRSFWYATAGHPPPYLADEHGVRQLETGGLPLGLRIEGEGQNHRLTLDPGALLVLYTDGLIEFNRDLFAGEALVRSAIAEEQLRPTSDPAQAVKEAVLRRASQTDDVAILTVRVAPVPVHAWWRLEPEDVVAAHVLRREIARELRTFANAESDLAAAEVALGELLANAVSHAPGSVRIELDWTARAAQLSIGDLGSGIVTERRLPDVYSERGRGIFLVAHLCPGFAVETDERGVTTARATLPVYRDVAAAVTRA